MLHETLSNYAVLRTLNSVGGFKLFVLFSNSCLALLPLLDAVESDRKLYLKRDTFQQDWIESALTWTWTLTWSALDRKRCIAPYEQVRMLAFWVVDRTTKAPYKCSPFTIYMSFPYPLWMQQQVDLRLRKIALRLWLDQRGPCTCEKIGPIMTDNQ